MILPGIAVCPTAPQTVDHLVTAVPQLWQMDLHADQEKVCGIVYRGNIFKLSFCEIRSNPKKSIPGDCDSDSDCGPGLRCDESNCLWTDDPAWDCCVPDCTTDSGPLGDCCPTAVAYGLTCGIGEGL